MFYDHLKKHLKRSYSHFLDCPQIEEIKEFRREIDMMKSVGRHPNIVGILGHCTQNISDMLLLTEFCSEGSLLDYLR